MYTRPAAPRSIGGVLDDSIRLYRASARQWWLPSLLAAALPLLTALALFAATGQFSSAGMLTGAATPQQALQLMRSPAVWGTYLALVLFSIYFYCVIGSIAVAVHRGESPTFRESLAVGLRTFPASFVATILFLLAIGAAFVAVIIPGTMIGMMLSPLMRIVGVLVLLALPIFLWGRLQYWSVAIQAEGDSGTAALGQSWSLSRGHWWRGTTIAGVALIILMVVMLALFSVIGILAATLARDVLMLMLVTQGLSAMLNVAIIPVFPTALTATYFDLKLRREGGDLAARVGGLKRA